MADYIERTEALILAMNAGARAIENTKKIPRRKLHAMRFQPTVKQSPYLEAARVLRDASDAPAASVAEGRARGARYKNPHSYADRIPRRNPECLQRTALIFTAKDGTGGHPV